MYADLFDPHCEPFIHLIMIYLVGFFVIVCIVDRGGRDGSSSKMSEAKLESSTNSRVDNLMLAEWDSSNPIEKARVSADRHAVSIRSGEVTTNTKRQEKYLGENPTSPRETPTHFSRKS
jgi:hypothetical protein